MKKKIVYEAEDGRGFATKEEARAYESGLALVAYLTRVLSAADIQVDDVEALVDAIVDAIRADTAGLAEAIKPLLRKRTRADAGVKRGPRAVRGRGRAAA